MDSSLLLHLIPLSLGLTITAVAFLSTHALIPFAIRISDIYGLVDIPDKRRIHLQPVPRSGGIALYAGIFLACFFILLLSPLISKVSISFLWVFGMFAGGTIIFLTGLLDDLIGMKAVGKLSGQVFAVILMYVCGIKFQIFFGYALPWLPDLLLTILWFLLIINAFNLIDGLDGLASGIACIAALGIAGFLIQRKLPFEACLLFAVVGATLGFLKYNRYPAKIFLGDSGSNFLGFFMAAMMLMTGSKSTAIGYLWAPLLAVVIPAADLCLAVCRRFLGWFLSKLDGTNAPLSIMSGDLEHLHHRLLKLNLHPRDAAATLCLVNALFVLGGLMAFPYEFQGWGFVLASAIIFGFLAWRYLLKSEINKTLQIICRLFARPKSKIAALSAYVLFDLFIIIFSLLVAVRIAHPDFPIPVVIERSYRLYSYWIPLGFLIAYMLEAKALKRFNNRQFNILGVALTFAVIFNSYLGFHFLLGEINFARATSKLISFIAMSFLLLVFARFSLAVVEVYALNEGTNGQGAKPGTKRLKNLKFYGRLFSRT